MKATQLNELLVFSIKHNLPILIKGKPGIGKSDIVEQATKDAGAELIISHPVVSDPTDFKGLPYAANGEAHFLPFGDLKRIIDADKPTVYFLDDLGQAPAAVQAACMQLLLARRINGHKVSDYVTFIAATNRREDRAAVNGLLEPVKSRFASIVELEVDTNDWVDWALNKGNMPIELVAFIRFRPEVLDAAKPTLDITNTPSPRTIASVGKMQKAGIPSHLMFEAFTGAAGEAFAAEYKTFLDDYKELPSIDQILMNPSKVKMPEKISVLYAVATALAPRVNDVNIDNAFEFITRMQPEFAVLCVKDIVKRNEQLAMCKAYQNWAIKNGNLITG